MSLVFGHLFHAQYESEVLGVSDPTSKVIWSRMKMFTSFPPDVSRNWKWWRETSLSRHIWITSVTDCLPASELWGCQINQDTTLDRIKAFLSLQTKKPWNEFDVLEISLFFSVSKCLCSSSIQQLLTDTIVSKLKLVQSKPEGILLLLWDFLS